MRTQKLSADYLVIGSGAAGMAFTDALIAEQKAQVIMIDRRHAPGGHWNDAYPFVRLHQPSAFYGVNSTPLGADAIDAEGENQGHYERATAPEICGYYQRVLDTRLLPSGQVRYFPMCEYLGEGRFVSRVTGTVYETTIHKKEVDARYLEPTIPATLPAPFEVDSGATCLPVNALSRLLHAPAGYVILGAGKTAMDAIFWLLERGTQPEDICWIKPREGWLTNRAFWQPGKMVGSMIEASSFYAEAGAKAKSLEEYFARISERELLLRVDERVTPTMCKGPTINARELSVLRRVENVVRLGKVRRIERHRIVLEEGTIPTSPDHLHVHCAASGARKVAPVPGFTERKITLQALRLSLPCLSAAITAYIETTRSDVDEQNRLCSPHSYPDVPLDWPRMMLHTMKSDYRWSSEPDVDAWMDRARLNPVRGWKERFGEPRIQTSTHRYVEFVRPALANLERILAESAVS